jgi:histidyl-tRNA synthetase
VELLGGRPTPGIGFGLGLDRTILAMEAANVTLPASAPIVGVVGDGPASVRLLAATRLRDAGLRVLPDGSDRKLGKQLESAAKHGARWAVILAGEPERVALKDLDSGEQRDVTLHEVAGSIG